MIPSQLSTVMALAQVANEPMEQNDRNLVNGGGHQPQSSMEELNTVSESSQTGNLSNNNTESGGFIVTGDEKEFDERLRGLLNCYDRPYKSAILQRGDFWVLENYIRADHGELKCHETITYTTHSDYTFLDNLLPLLIR